MILTLPPVQEDNPSFSTLRNMEHSQTNDQDKPEFYLAVNGRILDSSSTNSYRSAATAGGRAGSSSFGDERRIIAAGGVTTSNNTSLSAITVDTPYIQGNSASPSTTPDNTTPDFFVGDPRTTSRDDSRRASYYENGSNSSPGNSIPRYTSGSSDFNTRGHGTKTLSPSSRVPTVSSKSSSSSPQQRNTTAHSTENSEDKNRNASNEATRRRKRSMSSPSRYNSNMDQRRSRHSISVPDASSTGTDHMTPASNNRTVILNSADEVHYQLHQQQGLFKPSLLPNNGNIRFANSHHVINGTNAVTSSMRQDFQGGNSAAGQRLSVLNHHPQGGNFHVANANHGYGGPTYSHQSSVPPMNSNIMKGHQIIVNSPHPGLMSHAPTPGTNTIYTQQGGMRTNMVHPGGQAVFLPSMGVHNLNQPQEVLVQVSDGNGLLLNQQHRVVGYEHGMKRQVIQEQQMHHQQHGQYSNSSNIPVQWMNYHTTLPSNSMSLYTNNASLDPYAQSTVMATQQQQQQAVPTILVSSQMMQGGTAQRPFVINNSYVNGFSHGTMPSAEVSSNSPGRGMDSSSNNDAMTYQTRHNSHGNNFSSSREPGSRRNTSADHHSNRKIKTLETSGDSIWLSDFLCFLRKECCEVITATAKDVQERRKSKQIKLKQVGIRCRFCAHLPHNRRAGRSSCFPSSVDRIYQSVTMMIREHFPICEEFPDDIRRKYVFLKKSTKKGEMESKAHWKRAARELGMVDTSDGIFFEDDLQQESENQTPAEQDDDGDLGEHGNNDDGTSSISSSNLNQQPSSATAGQIDKMTAL